MKKLEDCFMSLGDYAYDPFIKDEVEYVKVIFIYDTSLLSIHLLSDLSLVETTMSSDLIEDYTEDLIRNQSLIRRGLDA